MNNEGEPVKLDSFQHLLKNVMCVNVLIVFYLFFVIFLRYDDAYKVSYCDIAHIPKSNPLIM